MNASTLYSTKQIAELCNVSIWTAIRWIDAGELPAYRTPGGRRRVAVDDLRAFLERFRMPIPRELSRQRVLIVDDDPLVLKAAQRQLRHRYDVVVAATGYDGLVLAGSTGPDVIVLDLFMPEVDGFEVCASIRRSMTVANVTVIALTGRFTDEVKRRALKAGADVCLAKADALGALAVTIGALVGERAAR